MSKKSAISEMTMVPMILSAVLAACPLAYAQGPAPAQASGPVDIQANEQEFSGDQVIAKGNVRVLYKDSIIHAPHATLFRDAGGNPQRAVFTGHPKLVQGKSLIDAETLSFDIANSRVIADGNAHSEVESTEEAPKGDKKADKNRSLGSQSKSQDGKPAPPEKIITDADHQEYDRDQDKFEAVGHVKVVHGDITVHAEKLNLVYGADKKPETAIFTGNVVAQQDQNNTAADNIVYNLSTRRLQASGHVKSKVVQPKGDAKKVPATKPGPQAYTGANPGAAYAAAGGAAKDPAGDETIIVTSDSQDNSEQTGRVDAEGNVSVYYQDMVGMGPKVILVRNSEGKAEKVYFVGRSQVSQTGRRWIADRITMRIADKKVMAEGNTKALILPVPKQGPQAPPASKLADKPAANSISTRRIETPQ